MKAIITLIIILSTNSIFSQKYGIYWTHKDFIENNLDTTYKFGATRENEVIFTQNGNKKTIYTSEFYGLISVKNEFFRTTEKLGLLKMHLEGKICLWAPLYFDFKTDCQAIVQSFYISEGKDGEMIRGLKKTLKEKWLEHPDVYELYIKEKDIFNALKIFNGYSK